MLEGMHHVAVIATEPIHEDRANGGHDVFFRDPDGLPLELHD